MNIRRIIFRLTIVVSVLFGCYRDKLSVETQFYAERLTTVISHPFQFILNLLKGIWLWACYLNQVEEGACGRKKNCGLSGLDSRVPFNVTLGPFIFVVPYYSGVDENYKNGFIVIVRFLSDAISD